MAFENPDDFCCAVAAVGFARAPANETPLKRGDGFEMCADTIMEVFRTSNKKHLERQRAVGR